MVLSMLWILGWTFCVVSSCFVLILSWYTLAERVTGRQKSVHLMSIVALVASLLSFPLYNTWNPLKESFEFSPLMQLLVAAAVLGTIALSAQVVTRVWQWKFKGLPEQIYAR